MSNMASAVRATLSSTLQQKLGLVPSKTIFGKLTSNNVFLDDKNLEKSLMDSDLPLKKTLDQTLYSKAPFLK